MTVYLIGAGPGDPELITVRGQRILQEADVILHDRLISPDLLTLAKPDALIIDVGKHAEGKTTPQERINQLLVKHGQAGKCVARLKGGDPFVFGRGGEEVQACQAASIKVEVIPGVTSAIAAPAYAGVPVTHRDVSTSFVVVTGHEHPDKAESTVNYAALAQLETLVFLMGVRRLPEITASLMAHGRDPQTPVICVEWGTYPQQRTVSGTLATITAIAQEQDLKAPAVIVIGKVAGLAATLAWQHQED